MNETEFHLLADRWLATISDVLEGEETLDVEYLSGVLTISLLAGKMLVVSKHAPSKQLWLASPISGGLHFLYDDSAKQWVLKDGQSLEDILSMDIEKLSGVKLSF